MMRNERRAPDKGSNESMRLLYSTKRGIMGKVSGV